MNVIRAPERTRESTADRSIDQSVVAHITTTNQNQQTGVTHLVVYDEALKHHIDSVHPCREFLGLLI